MTIKNGKPYTQIDNEMLEALLLIKTTKRKIKIMLEVCRKLTGFDNEGDKIPLSQFKEDTGIAKGNASKPLRECIEENMLIRREGSIYLQEDIWKWKGVIKLITSKGLSKRLLKGYQKDNKKVINLDPSKETPKETTKRKVLSKKMRKKKQEEFKKGFAMIREVMGKIPEKKK